MLVAAARRARRLAQLEALLARHADGEASERDRDPREGADRGAYHRGSETPTGGVHAKEVSKPESCRNHLRRKAAPATGRHDGPALHLMRTLPACRGDP